MTIYKSFETERLRLEATAEQDAAFLLELMNSPKWLKFIGDRNVKSIEEAQTYIQSKMLPQLERLGFSNYTIIRKADNVKMGTCGLYDRIGLDGIDIGFAFLPDFEQQGYGFEAVNYLKNFAFEKLGIQEIKAITMKDNFSAQKLLEKIGMNLADTIILPNTTEELLLYKIRKKEHEL